MGGAMSAQQASAEDVLGALDRTVKQGPARGKLQLGVEDMFSEAPKLAPLVYRPLLRFMFDRLKRMQLPEVPASWVVVDFEGHRCMCGYPWRPDQAALIVGDRRWEGPIGTPVAAVPATSFPVILNPVWAIDLLRGVERVRVKEEEVINGRACQRFEAYADLARAGEHVAYDMAVSTRNGLWRDLRRIPVELWIETRRGLIRRLRVVGDRGTLVFRLDLRQFRIEPPSDWSLLWLP